MTSLTDLPQVKQLSSLFDLDTPPSHRMVVTKWGYCDGEILIMEAEAYDTEGNFVKKVGFEQLQHNMHKYSFTFMKQSKL